MFPSLNINPNMEETAPMDYLLHVPIAIRKEVRSCTKHPVSNYLTYAKISPKYRAFTALIANVEIPTNIQQALENYK